MVDEIKLRQLSALVARANRILVGSHANCGDATGSVTALVLILEAMGKRVTAFLPEPVSKSLAFLPAAERVVTDSMSINWDDFDLYLSVDAAEPKLTGLMELYPSRPSELTLVNFDHHHTNPGYGDVNIIDRTAPATCAMLYEWFVLAGYPMDRRAATCLLVGILTDTGTFSNPATNELALGAASDLMLKGANVTRVLNEVVRSKTLQSLKVWGKALERLREHPTLNIVSTVITRQELEESSAESLEGLANFLNDLAGYRAVLVLKEMTDGTVKGSLRTTRDDVDVSAIAKALGGGGHKKAAGFTMPGRLVETPGGWKVEVH